MMAKVMRESSRRVNVSKSAFHIVWVADRGEEVEAGGSPGERTLRPNSKGL